MAEYSREIYQVNDLDPTILSTPFKVDTSWHVITGAPCSGKTTLIEIFAQAGFQTARETAREYFEREMAKGRTSQQVRASGNTTQMGIFKMQLDLENGLPPERVVILDRGLPDSLTFFRLCGLIPDQLLPECLNYRYASVFILDRLPFSREQKLGLEDEKSARFIDLWLERDYAALGYPVVRVPVCPPQERFEFLLERITALNNF